MSGEVTVAIVAVAVAAVIAAIPGMLALGRLMERSKNQQGGLVDVQRTISEILERLHNHGKSLVRLEESVATVGDRLDRIEQNGHK